MRIVWIVPGVSSASGGMRTIVQAANALAATDRHTCGICVNEVTGPKDIEAIRAILLEEYGLDPVINVIDLSSDLEIHDCLVATMWDTAETVWLSSVPRKAYFVQDFEPWFYPMGDTYLEALATYTLGLAPLTIGRWLCHKLSCDMGVDAHYFDFCADTSVYMDLMLEREDAVCAVYQPDKPRRCDKLLISALQLVKERRPQTTIYLYGSDVPRDECMGLECIDRGILSTEACNMLYNTCRVGVCCSSSNPSRIPFEMMAAGLPTIDIFGENTSYDFPAETICLAQPDRDSLAGAIIAILEDEDRRHAMSTQGSRFMKTRPIKHEADSIVAFFDKLESNGAGSLAKQKDPPRLIEQGFKASPSLVAYAKDSMRKQRDGAIARQIEAREEQLDNAISGEGFILDVILSHALTRGDRIRAAIWAGPDQSDVTFYEAEQVDEGRWRCAVMCKDHDNRSGCYNIHVYIEGDQGATLQRIGCFERMVICPKGIPAEHQDANPTTLPAQDMKVLSIATRPIAPGLADDPSRPDTLRSRIGRMLRRH